MARLNTRAVIAALFLSSACAASIDSHTEMAAALHADDECASAGSGACTLELAQLRAVLLAEQAPAAADAMPPPADVAPEQIPNANSEASSDPDGPSDDFGHPAWLQGCHTIFLDVGSSLGVNVRKLFEPNKYPGSALLPFFTEHIGSQGWRRSKAEKSGLCALGLEPSPRHQAHLQKLQQAYQNQGWNVHFYPFAAWREDGSLLFSATGKHPPQPGDEQMGGGHLEMHSAAEGGGDAAGETAVRTVDFARFLRSLPGAVDLMVVDIEGAEYEVLAQLMQQDGLCQSSVRHALVEAHNWGDVTHWGTPDVFQEGVHPRSFLAMAQHVAELEALGFCAPGGVTEISEFNDLMFTSDVDDWFGAREKEDGVA